MFLIVSDDLHSLTSKELEYITKIVLLREFENCIDLLLGQITRTYISRSNDAVDA